MELTKEQQDCVLGATDGQDLKTKAFAGSGKTSTLVAIAKALPDKKILYLAYNKAIQLDAEKKFPKNVKCQTAHSLAFCRLAHIIGNRTAADSPKLNIANTIKYGGISSKHDYSAEAIARQVLKMLRRFVQSSYSKKYLKPKEIAKNLGQEEQQAAEVQYYIHEIASDYWDRCMKIGSELPINHDIYLKKYQLTRPKLSMLYDVILFDECQDANPVILDIVIKQECQKIYVGDEHQQIYGWRGAINAFAGIDGEEYYLSQSFRFGNEVARLANQILIIKGEVKELKGFGKIDTQIVENIDQPHTTVLCRTNGRAIEVILANLDKDIHLVGNNIKYTTSLLEDACALYEKRLHDVKNSLLKSYKSWEELLIEYKDDEEKDPNLTLIINFVDKYSCSLIPTLEKFKSASYVDEADADLIVSTVHKSKGREWDNVVVESDFRLSEELLSDEEIEKEKIDYEELNLLYVAITRAQQKLLIKGYLIPNIYNIFANLKTEINHAN